MSSPKTTSTSSSYGVQALPKIVYRRGSYLYDTDGKRYIDGSGGPAVYCLGHEHPEVTEAVKSQLDRVAHGYRYLFTSDAVVAGCRDEHASARCGECAQQAGTAARKR